MQFFAPSLISLVVLGLTGGAAAVCSGQSIAIGTAANASTSGYTQYKIYDTSCDVKNTNVFLTTASVCDNAEFLCAAGTKTIAEYDDPTNGWAYTCAADTTSESCSGDAITYCCYPKAAVTTSSD